MDIFGGVLTGSSFAGDVHDQYKELDKPQGLGHWFMVFRPEMFLESKEEYLKRMDTLLERVRNSEKADGVERVYTPGEIEWEKAEEQRRDGILLTRQEVQALNELAVEWGSGTMLSVQAL